MQTLRHRLRWLLLGLLLVPLPSVVAVATAEALQPAFPVVTVACPAAGDVCPSPQDRDDDGADLSRSETGPGDAPSPDSSGRESVALGPVSERPGAGGANAVAQSPPPPPGQTQTYLRALGEGGLGVGLLILALLFGLDGRTTRFRRPDWARLD